MTAAEQRLEKAKNRLDNYYKAEEAVLAGQSYRIGTRNLTRADLQVIEATIEKLENRVAELEAQVNGRGSRKTYRITPRDL